jgi:FKBP-type peptidyl-prolyl cis-trans isomerase
MNIDTTAQKISYSLGLDIGANLLRLQNIVDIDQALVQRGVEDSFKRRDPLISREDFMAAMQDFQQRVSEAQTKGKEQQAAAIKEMGGKYLEDNAKKPGVIVTPSGLQYEILVEGAGAAPTLQDSVQVHYRGSLIDGTEFDSSYERGVPATFPLSQVIPGWSEGVQLMKVGGKSRFTMPSELAYGNHENGPIPPNSVLIFETELLNITN